MRNACFIAAAIVLSAGLSPALGQQQLPRPGQPPGAAQQQPRGPAPPQQRPGGQERPAIAPAQAYKIVALKPPQSWPDPTLAAFRKEIGAIAERKDRAALARHVVAQGFFWLKPPQGADGADKRKLGIDSLVAALKLNVREGYGWDALADLASNETAMPFPRRQGVICSPADPQFNPAELEAVAKATGTGAGEWAYTAADGAEVRAKPQANAPVIEKLGVHFVRVLPEEPQSGAASSADEETSFVRVVTPAGRVGYVAEDAISPLGADQLCYSKDASGAWKIAGFIGGQE